MNWAYEIFFYFDKILLSTAFVIVLMWSKNRGKTFLAMFLMASVLGSVIFYVTNTLMGRDILDYDSSTRVFLYMIGWVLGFLSTITLFCFVIVVKLGQLEPAKEKGQIEISKYMRGLSEKEKRSILQRREWTYLLDNLIVNAVTGLFLVGLAVMVEGIATSYGQFDGIIFTLVCLISIMYFLFKDSFGGRSIAKAITGLRVVDVATGEPIGPSKSITRNWIFLIPIFPIVELIVANIRKDKRRLGDLMANTVVIRIKQNEVS